MILLLCMICLFNFEKKEREKEKILNELNSGLNLEYDDSLEDGKKNNFENNKDIELSIKNVNDNE